MLLLLAGCTEYGLDFWDPPEAPRSEPPDPHGTASWVIPDEEEACELRAEPVAARPEATCDAVGFESFEAVRERSGTPGVVADYLEMPIAIPQSGASTLALGSKHSADGDDLLDVLLLDGATLELVGTIGNDLGHPRHVAAARSVGVNAPPGEIEVFLGLDAEGSLVCQGEVSESVAQKIHSAADQGGDDWGLGTLVRDVDLDGRPDVGLGALLVGNEGAWALDPWTDAATKGGAIWDRTGMGELSMGIGDGEYDIASGSITPWAWATGWKPCCVSLGVGGSGGTPILLVVDPNTFLWVDATGSRSWTVPHAAEHWLTAWMPAFGDLDGDTLVDVALQMGESVWFVHAAGPRAGEMFWSYRMGSYGDTTASYPVLADLDADGTYEAVVWSEYGLFILSATSVAPVYSDTSIGTKAFNSSPLVADIDGDGSAEIVVIGDEVTDRDEFHYGYIARNDTVFVYGAAHGEWARTRPVWNQGAYDITTVRDDGAIVRFPRPSWQQYNAWRAQPAHDGVHPDLAPRVTGACADVCGPGGAVTLTAVVDNLGAAEAPAGAEVVLSTWGQGETWIHEVVRTTLPDAVPVGGSSAEFAFTVPWESWKDARVIDVWGTHSDECDYVNDRIDVAEDPCAE